MERSLPDEWAEQYLSTGDLESSLEKLDGEPHFFAEAMRGRIASLRLMRATASLHFQNAIMKCRSAEPTVENVIRAVTTLAFKIENELLSPSLSLTQLDSMLKKCSLPQPRQNVDVDDRLLYAFLLLASVRGKLLLRMGKDLLARGVFEELLRADGRDVNRAVYHTGFACALWNAGHEGEAKTHIENAGLHLTMCESPSIGLAQAASCLIAACYSMDEADEAEGWVRFLEDIDIHESSLACFRQRYRQVVQMSLRESRLLLA